MRSKGIIYIKYLAQCLAHRECSGNRKRSCHYYLFIAAGAQSYLCCSGRRGLGEGAEAGPGVGLGRQLQGGCGCGSRCAAVGRGCWVRKAGEVGASRVEDMEVSDCIYIKVLLR